MEVGAAVGFRLGARRWWIASALLELGLCGYGLALVAGEIAESFERNGEIALEVGAVGFGLGEALADGEGLLEVGLGGFGLALVVGEVAEVPERDEEIALEVGAVGVQLGRRLGAGGWRRLLEERLGGFGLALGRERVRAPSLSKETESSRWSPAWSGSASASLLRMT